MDEHPSSASNDNNYTDSAWFIHECHVDLDNTSRRVALFLLYLLFFMAGLTLNALVVWVNWHRRSSRNGVLFCILNVGVSDLLMTVMVPFFMLEAMMEYVWVWGYLLCRFTNLVYDINFYSSSFFLAYMTVERYLAVVRTGPRPWGPKQARLRCLLCGFLWVLSVVLGLLENAHVTLLEWDEPGCYSYPEHNFIDWNTAHTFLYLIFQFLGPAAIIVTFNLLTLRAVRARPEGAVRGKELWLVHLYSLVFVLCWLPLHIVLMLLVVDELNPRVLSCQTVEKIYFSYFVVKALSLFHCVANPILYNFLSRSFRGNLIADLTRHLPRDAVARGRDENHGNRVGNGRAAANEKAKELSNASTSQSDVES
ncbi:G-protein coupled receptor 182-like [Oncorhynchus nerka]|uniref:G-protein coupled receptor 182-like n=1 Tax=Oncorhynchus nerka TaxID=8023 RepID=UPI00112FD89C|nr:G-protein coupled receptor 182-like [Oncorhynchus nerka]XP_035633903.1 G-protein coupled receptor 182-like [Oncorhynchus keta]